MNASARITTLAIALTLAACADDPPIDRVLVRDSAGVQVVESPELVTLSDDSHQWSLVLEREFRTADSHPSADPAIWEPENVARTDDGSLVVADLGPQRLVIVRDGGVVSRFAQPGRGPGEITAPGGGLAIRPMPDGSIVVVEMWGNRRIHRFTATGELIDDTPMENFSSRWSVGRTRDEITVQVATPGNRTGDPFAQHVSRLNLRTGEVEPLLTLARTVEPDPAGQPAGFPMRFWTAFPDGGFVTMRTDSAHIYVYGEDAALARIIRLPLTSAPMTLEIERRMRELYPQYPVSDFAETRRMIRKLVSVDDSLFALEHSWSASALEDGVDGDTLAWRLISTTGHQRGTVRFPPSFDPWLSTDGRVLGVLRDSLGVATIQEYRLIPPG